MAIIDELMSKKTIIEQFFKAIEITKEAFAYKVDIAGKKYYSHIESVVKNLKGNGGVCEVVGYLHDLLEDCPEWTAERLLEEGFSEQIVTAVVAITKQNGENYQEYLARVKCNFIARIVKLADLKDNMDITRLPELTGKDIERLKKYHKAHKFLSEY